MRAIATTPLALALHSFKEFLSEMNAFLYGTQERANRSIGIAFLTIVGLQAWGVMNSAPVVCGF